MLNYRLSVLNFKILLGHWSSFYINGCRGNTGAIHSSDFDQSSHAVSCLSPRVEMFKARQRVSALLIVKVVDKRKVVHRFHSAVQLQVRKARRKHQIILSLKEFLAILFHSYPEAKKNRFWKLNIYRKYHLGSKCTSIFCDCLRCYCLSVSTVQMGSFYAVTW